MNCAECKELLVAYIEGLLDESQNQTVTEHLKDCRTCQAEVKQLTDLRDRLTKNGNTLALSNLENTVMNKILREQNVRLKAADKAGTGPKLRRIIMKSPITKLAAAAVIIIAVLIGVFQFGSPLGSVALADVLERIEQVQAFMYKMKMTGNMMPNKPEAKQQMQGTIIISNEYGMKLELNIAEPNTGETMTQQMYVIPSQKVICMVMPEQKKYTKMEFDDDLLTRMKKQNNDPREMIKQIMMCEYAELGRSVIDGIEVEGFQTTDPAFAAGVAEDVDATLWVAVKSQLPVRQEFNIKVNEQMEMHGVVYDYQWDIPVDISEFEPVIPEDFTALPTEGMKIPSINKESAIEGLRFFAEITGKYPDNLSMVNLMQEFGKFEEGQTPAPVSKQLRQELEQLQTEEEIAAKVVDMIRPVQSLALFHMTLVQEKKDPAYYGKSVLPEFADAVLLRWKVAEGQYRVIFGDLTTEDVTAERLAELESQPLNAEPKAIKPQPADAAEGIRISEIQLSWMPGAYVTEHKVYFGTNADSLSLLTEVSDSSSILAPALQRHTSYYWRVDEIQPDGSIVTGDIWSFNTGRLVAWWTLDDGSGDITIDDSGNGNDGSLVGDTSWTPGIIGGALRFDGDGDYVDIGNPPALNITNQITVSAWIKVDAFDRDWQAIITKGDGSWRLQRDNNSNHLEFACTGLAVPGSQWSNIFGTIDVNDGQWHHAVGVYDGSMMYLYTDGKLDTSAKASGTIQINYRPVYIGENAQRPGRGWNGLIDDVQIYNYALTADEIAAIYKEKKVLPGD